MIIQVNVVPVVPWLFLTRQTGSDDVFFLSLSLFLQVQYFQMMNDCVFFFFPKGTTV